MSFTKVLVQGLQNITGGALLGRSTGTGDVQVLNSIPSGVEVPAARLSGDIDPGRITTALNASGSAPIYACRAWVNFNGTGTVAIRASGNVSSITDNSAGNYTVNFANALPDVNYSVHVTGFLTADTNAYALGAGGASTTTQAVARLSRAGTATLDDSTFVSVAIFR